MVNTFIVDEDVIQAGGNFNLIMGVQNQGTITAHNLSVIIGNSSDSSGSSNTNFLPLGLSNICVTRDVLGGRDSSDGTGFYSEFRRRGWHLFDAGGFRINR